MAFLNYPELKKSNLEVLRSNFPEFSIQEDSDAGERSWVNVISFGMFGDKDIPAPSNTE